MLLKQFSILVINSGPSEKSVDTVFECFSQSPYIIFSDSVKNSNYYFFLQLLKINKPYSPLIILCRAVIDFA